MDDRKWEDLPIDCLENIFARVGLEYLIDRVPYVCKSWHKATLSPLCWQSLIIELRSPIPVLFWTPGSLKCFVKFVIRRSQGTVNVVKFMELMSMKEEVLTCIGEGCPSLKRLGLGYCNSGCMEIILNMICKWKDLEALQISPWSLLEVIPQISIHCNKFVSLSAINIEISTTAASHIAMLLPKIKFLSLRLSKIEKSDLVVIMKGCAELVYLDVSHCSGFEVDDEILNLADHLTSFKYEGVRLYHDNPKYYCYPTNYDLYHATDASDSE